MTDYYVDSVSGSNSNPGTEALPWLDLEKVSAESALGTFGPGDRILLKRGCTWNLNSSIKRLNFRGSSGSYGNDIYIGPYGEGADPILDVTADIEAAIQHTHTDTDANHVTVDSLEIKASGAGTDFIGVYLRGVDHWTLKNLYVHDIPASLPGISAGIVTRKSSTFVIIENCTVDNITGEGIYLGKAGDLTDRPFRTIVRDTMIKDCDGDGLDVKDGPHVVIVHGCTFQDNGLSASHGPHQAICGGQRIYFYDCRFEFTGSVGGNTDAINLGALPNSDWSGRYAVVERCLFKNCTGTRGAIQARGDNHKIINNTFVSCRYAIYAWSHAYDGSGSIVVKNNIFYGSTVYDVYVAESNSNSYYTFDYNNYDGTSNVWYYNGAARTLSYVQTTLSQEANAVSGDPVFAETTNYTLDSTTPCDDVGLNSETVYDWNDEYAGTGAVDLGWQERGWNTDHRVLFSVFDDLGNFDGSTGVSASGGLLTVSITDTSDRYAYKNNLGNLQHLWAQFYVDVDSLTMGSGDEFVLFEGRTSGGTTIVWVYLDYDGSNFRVKATVQDDSTTQSTGYHNLITGDTNQIQIGWYAAHETTETEGYLSLEVNGTKEEILSSLDNDSNTIDQIRIGATSGVDATTSGTLYIDNLDVDWLRFLTSEVSSPAPPDSGNAVYKNDANLQALWLFEDNLDDYTPNNNDLTGSGSPTYSTDAQEGIKSIDLEAGSSQYAYITDAAQVGLDITGDMTICAWIKLESAGTRNILAKWDSGKSYRFYVDSIGYLSFRLRNSGDTANGTAVGATALNTGTWYHVAGAYDGTDIRVYVGGSLDSNGSNNPYSYSGGINDSTEDVEVGKIWTTYYDGLIDELAVFNRALSADEIADIYNNGIQDPANVPGLMRFYRSLRV